MFGICIFLFFFNVYRNIIVDTLQIVIKLAQHTQRLNIIVKYIKKIIT